MDFQSILFPRGDPQGPNEAIPVPDCFHDLNLDQVEAAITAEKAEYRLESAIHTPLAEADDIAFRQEVMRDLEAEPISAAVHVFADAIATMRSQLRLGEKLHYAHQKQRWFLEAVSTYCNGVERFARELAEAGPRSRGLSGILSYLSAYLCSDAFKSLAAETRQVRSALAAIRYSFLIDGLRVELHENSDQSDYSADVQAVFERFRQGPVREYRFDHSNSADMNHVEDLIFGLVAKTNPNEIAALECFWSRHANYLDLTVARFDREVQFYVAYLAYIAPLKAAGLPFCYPEVGRDSKEVSCRDGFDLALAAKLAAGKALPVPNDFELNGAERILVVSGPNQGGKTTFARMFGQVHYLASLGCPVPGTGARLYLFDRLFTHFERGENIGELKGKLQDDLLRVREILDQATPDSIVILNEIFTSTTLQDALFLSGQIMAHLRQLDLIGVWVTFVDEVTTAGAAVVSMVSSVDPDDPTRRTYRILRGPANGLSYAMSIAQKYGLTSEQLSSRLPA